MSRETDEILAELRQNVEYLRLFGDLDPVSDPLVPWRSVSPDEFVRSGAPILHRASAALEKVLGIGVNRTYAELKSEVRAAASQRCALLFVNSRVRAVFEDAVGAAALVRVMGGLGQKRGLESRMIRIGPDYAALA